MVSRIKEMIAWVGVVFMIAVGVFFGGRRSAKKDDAVARAKDSEKAKGIHNEIQTLDDARIVELANKWVRNK